MDSLIHGGSMPIPEQPPQQETKLIEDKILEMEKKGLMPKGK
jgi:hypothetical protein